MRPKIKNIKVIFSDVDGTLTDGSLYYLSSGDTLKKFHAHDGQGIKLWRSTGRLFGFLSARECPLVKQRAKELQVDECALQVVDKIKWMDNWLDKHQLSFENLAYIGDDINDVKLISKACYSATPKDAIRQIQKKANYICKKKGGEGAVREFIDHLLLKLFKSRT